MLGLRNDVGLLAEQYDPTAGCQLGNFPQAFSHLTLIGTALNLSRGKKPVEQRQAPEGPARKREASHSRRVSVLDMQGSSAAATL